MGQTGPLDVTEGGEAEGTKARACRLCPHTLAKAYSLSTLDPFTHPCPGSLERERKKVLLSLLSLEWLTRTHCSISSSAKARESSVCENMELIFIIPELDKELEGKTASVCLAITVRTDAVRNRASCQNPRFHLSSEPWELAVSSL